MEQFLRLVAKDLHDNFMDGLKGLSDVTVVFPNRRARLFFDGYMSELCDSPLWSPSYMTIEELFRSQSSLEIADQYKLVSILYNVYCEQMGSDEELDSFWNWGELMLNDFNEIDRSLADSARLFACLENHREVTEQSFLSDEQNEILKSFFRGFNGHETALKQKYIRIWNALGPIYDRFRSILRKSGEAYDGMLQREVAETLDPSGFGSRTVAFVGFNSLDRAEHELFSKLKESGNAIFYWDYDRKYIDDAKSEAGLFMRSNLADFPNRLDASHFANMQGTKKFTIIETGSDSAQARYIPDWLDSLEGEADNDTAIVLCDESLLQPVLHSIPSEKTASMNITMGFPLGEIPLYGFMEALIDIQHSILKKEERLSVMQVCRILNNPLAECISEKAGQLSRELRQSHFSSTPVSELREKAGTGILFSPCHDVTSLLKNLRQVLSTLAGTVGQSNMDTVFQPMYAEAIFRMYTQVNRFISLVDENVLDLTPEMLCRLLCKVFRSTTVPFHGEPVSGIQILGLIETRNLDFRNVLVLSASEGYLPSGTSESSFIPYSIRKAFGLVTMTEKSAVSAYNFQHLLQRSDNVTMVYNGNTDNSSIGKGQMSRYLLQVIVGEENVRRIRLSSKYTADATGEELSCAKDDAILQALYNRYDANRSGCYLSPSAINSYLDCRFSFYLKYIAGIKRPDSGSDEIAPNVFGSIFHRTAELAYNRLAEENGRMITANAIRAILKDRKLLESFITSAFDEELFNGKHMEASEYNGIQEVNFEVIRIYIENILKSDISYTPFEYIGSEEKEMKHALQIDTADAERPQTDVLISGRIDRIDCRDGIYRIADYKTGKDNARKDGINDIEELFSGKERNKYAFQIFCYALIAQYDRKYSGRKLAPVLLYVRKAVNQENNLPYTTMCGTPLTDFTGTVAEKFEARLKETIAEIFDPNVPFSQTEDTEHCKHCDFKSICRR